MNYKVGDKRYSKSAEDIGIILDITDSYVYVKYPKFLNRTAYKKENFEKLTIPLFPGYFKNITQQKVVLFIAECEGMIIEQGTGYFPKGYYTKRWTSCLCESKWEYLPDYKEKESEMSKLTQIAQILIDNDAHKKWIKNVLPNLTKEERDEKFRFSGGIFMVWEDTEEGPSYWCNIREKLTDDLASYRFSFNEMEAEIIKLTESTAKDVPLTKLPQIAKILIDNKADQHWLDEASKHVKSDTDKAHFSTKLFFDWANSGQGYDYWCSIFNKITSKKLENFKFSFAEMEYEITEQLNKEVIEVVEEVKEQPNKKGAARFKKEPIAQSTKKDTFMSKIKSNLTTAVAQNKEALIVAAKLEAGNVLNKTIISKITPKLPFLLQGFAKHPAAEIVLANVAAMAIRQFAEGNEKLNKMADLMVGAAAVNTLSQFNIQEMVEDLLKDIKLPAGVLDADDK